MADLFDVGTLLTLPTLRQIVQHFGCPSFRDTNTSSWTMNTDREWYLYLFAGRVPSPAEFYHGTYIDRVGDCHKTAPLGLSSRLLGYLPIYSDARASSSEADMVSTIKAHGARWPEGAEFTREQVSPTNARVELDPNADDTWVLDWRFDTRRSYTIRRGALSSLISWSEAGSLAAPSRPTWFWLAPNDNATRVASALSVNSRDGNTKLAHIEQLHKADFAAHPLVMGTVGAIGSDADLILAEGGDAFSDKIRPVSLRIVLNETA